MKIIRKLRLEPDGFEDFVNVFVDGQDLGALIEGAEKRIDPGFGWGDESLSWSLTRSNFQTAFHEPLLASPGVHGVILFVCGCGQPACSPIDCWT